VVGGSCSAEYLALQLHKFEARSVTISFRTRRMGFKWPPGIEELPLLDRLNGSTAHFIDGQRRDFDALIFCTGYRHHFPFLADDLRLATTNRLYPPFLYKGVVFHDRPRLMYLGMQDLYFSFTLFDAQAWYCRDLLLGRRSLPSPAARASDMAAWQARRPR
jgi:trimethylamine monooxygenase